MIDVKIAKHAEYLTLPLNHLQKTCDRAVKKLTGIENEFEAIACTGVSGLLLAPLVALTMSKRLAVVRKAEDKDNHSSFRVETTMETDDRWIFLDDLICTASTLRMVRAAMVARGFGDEKRTYQYMENMLVDTVQVYVTRGHPKS